jgi:mannose-6-phosphate isomerase-like protein (cupin superfamily)
MSTRILSAADGGPCSFHVTRIRDSQLHYHKNTAEVYYILQGTGRMELNAERVEVRPGSVIRIDPGTRHRLEGLNGQEVTTVVVAIPAFDPNDEWFDN